MTLEELFKEYDRDYFEGGGVKSGYVSYREARGIVRELFSIIYNKFKWDIKTALDIGCAYGFSVAYLLEQGIDAYGCEPPTYALEEAKKYSWGNRVLESYLPELKDIKRTFDLVTATEVLEHIPEQYAQKSIKRIFEVCDKYIVLLIAMENVADINHEKIGDVTHVNVKPKEWWENLFKELGVDKFRRQDIEQEFSNHPTSKRMYWSGRFFVFEINQNERQKNKGISLGR